CSAPAGGRRPGSGWRARFGGCPQPGSSRRSPPSGSPGSPVESTAATVAAGMGSSPGMRLLPLICGVALALLGGFASTPSAPDYRAGPGGSGPTCSVLPPCNLPTAVNQATIAGSGNVLLASGTYNPAGGLNVSGAMDIGPEPGVPTPTIHAAGVSNVVNITNAGVVLHDVALEGSDVNTALRLLGGTAERISVTTTTGSPACSPEDGAILRDSVCWSNG